MATTSVYGQDIPAPVQNALAGAAVFGEKGCVRCHSVSGAGQSLGPDLNAAARARSFQDLTAALWNHLPDMSRRMDELGIERAHLSEREAGDLFAYLFTLGYFDAPGDRARGSAVFAESGCIVCHQVRGTGGVVGPVLDRVGGLGTPIEIAAAMWNHGPAMLAEAESRNIARPTLRGDQLADLIAFLKGEGTGTPDDDLYVLPGNPNAGRSALTDRGCVECHGTPGAGGGMAPDLATLGRGVSSIDFVARMWNKTPAMVAAVQARGLEFPTLEASMFADIVAYLYSVNYFSDAGSPGRGRAVLDRKGCTSCHDVMALASEPGLGHPASITAALWNHLDRLEESGDVASEWPEFSGREMADLMAFFQENSP